MCLRLPPCRALGGRREAGTLFAPGWEPDLAKDPRVWGEVWSQNGHANIPGKASRRRWPLAQFAMRGLRKGCSQEGGAAWGAGNPSWGLRRSGPPHTGVGAVGRVIMEDVPVGHTGEEVRAGLALPQGDEGPRYWAGRSGHHGGKMARDRTGSGAERLSGLVPQPGGRTQGARA